MKAIILAAGYGARLKPITKHVPKCLVEIDGKPLLHHWLDLLIEQGFSEVLVNTHYLADKVRHFIGSYKKNNCNLIIKLVHEDRLLGTAGTIWFNQNFVGDGDCVIINGDNLSNVNLLDLYNYHQEKKSILTLGYCLKDNPIGCGLLEMDENSRIIKFQEKPKKLFGNKIYSGIQVLNGKIFELLPFDNISHSNYEKLDFGYEVFPELVGKMIGYQLDCILIDIGNVEDYESAKRLWKTELNQS